MEMTGHPLVDVGLAIATLYNGKKSINDLNENDIEQAIQYLNKKIDPNKSKPGPLNSLKVLSAYWQNNPLAGHNMGTNGQNIPTYRNILIGKHNAISGNRYCQICGKTGVYIDVNRSWLPLGASSNGDPCSLPNLSGKHICKSCFSAVVLLPLGCMFSGNNPFLYHLNDPELICLAMKRSYDMIARELLVNGKGNDHLKADIELTGRVALLEIITGSTLWDITQGGTIIKKLPTGATIISFNNSGTSVSWNQLHIPAQAMEFLAELSSKDELRKTFISWATRCTKPEYSEPDSKSKKTNPFFEMLCDDIELRRSISYLVYSLKKGNSSNQILRKEEKQVLEIYERVALNKQDRFNTLVRIADRIKNDVDEKYSMSFRKRLANIYTKEALLKLLVEFSHSEKTGLRLSRDEINMIDSENAKEIISLLYLLIIAEE